MHSHMIDSGSDDESDDDGDRSDAGSDLSAAASSGSDRGSFSSGLRESFSETSGGRPVNTTTLVECARLPASAVRDGCNSRGWRSHSDAA